MIKIYKIILWLLFIVAFRNSYAQQCGNCKLTPNVAQYDLEVQVPQPELKGEKTKGWLEWLDLFWLARHANSYLFQNNSNCIRFKIGPDQDANADGTQDIYQVGASYTHLPHQSYKEGYITTGYVKKSGDGYVMHMEVQSACNRKTVAFTDVPFPPNSISKIAEDIAQQAAKQLMPLVDKIKEFELKERKENKDFALGGSGRELIKIVPASKQLATGQQTEIDITLLDCDGYPLAGREIVFTQGEVGGMKIAGTIGGTVTPSKIRTDANGKAKAKFTMTAGSGKPAIINAHTLTRTPNNCEDALTGSKKMDALPAFKITVTYSKSGNENMNMNSDEDGVAFKASEQKIWDAEYSFSLLYYLEKPPKEGEQIMIMPEFEELATSKKLGKTVILYNQGYSEYTISGDPLQLIKSPFGVSGEKQQVERQRYVSEKPLPPLVSFLFNKEDLVFFSGGAEFPERDEGLGPVASSFGIEKDNKTYFPLKPKKISDPNSPYKWKYEIKYHAEEGYSNEGKVFTGGKKEIEWARVQILKSF